MKEIVEKLKETNESYILVTPDCLALNGSESKIMTLLTALLNALYNDGMDDEMLDEAKKLAKMDEDEIKKETISKIKEALSKGLLNTKEEIEEAENIMRQIMEDK